MMFHRYSILLLSMLLPSLLNADNFPEGEFFVSPDESLAGASLDSAIQGTADFEKLKNFDSSSKYRKSGTRLGHLRISSPVMGGTSVCSGFLVGPDLFLTNNHCINSKGRYVNASDIKVYMEYWNDGNVGGLSSNVSSILKKSPNNKLDYALFKLSSPLGDRYGWFEFAPDSVSVGDPVYIVQHPQGRSKEVARKNTRVIKKSGKVLHYLADTQGGSSGSPVINTSNNKVVALHHVGVANHYNEGVNIDDILGEIRPLLMGGSAGSSGVSKSASKKASTPAIKPVKKSSSSSRPASKKVVDKNPNSPGTPRYNQAVTDILKEEEEW